MALKDTCRKMQELLGDICEDLSKAENGNKAAAQRVRTGTVSLEKIAKLYRKESVKAERSGSKKSTKKVASSIPGKSSSVKSSLSSQAKKNNKAKVEQVRGDKKSASSKQVSPQAKKVKAAVKASPTAMATSTAGGKNERNAKALSGNSQKRPTAKLPRKG